MNRSIRGALMTLGGGVCWGLSGSMGQFLFQHEGMDSRWLVPIRLFLAGVILFIFCFVKHRKALFQIWTKRRDTLLLLAYGLAGVSACQFTYFLTIQLSSAGVGTILQDLSPVMILICACIAGHRAPKPYEIICIALALAGVTLIVTHGDFGSLAVSEGALISGVICAACVTVYNMLTAPLTYRYPVVVLQAWSFLMGGAGLALIFRPWQFGYVPGPMGLVGIAFVVVVGNVLAFTLYITGVSLIGPSRGILYGFAEPVTAAVIGTALLGSPFTIWDALGFLAVFLMLTLISVNGRKALTQTSSGTGRS
ncbi:MAG: DMT family transporter [Chordicoccus sp.]